VRLLSRNAEALFWLARYLERGASLARVIEMQSSFGGSDQENAWSWLLTLHAEEERFRERFELSPTNIIAYYMTDSKNGCSIRSCIHWARENARMLRPFIPLEMWVQLNTFHGRTESLGTDAIAPAQLPRTCAEIRAGCLAQIGIAESTLFRDEGYLFFKLGLLVERADQTSRLLDVKFAQAKSGADPSEEFVFWSTILRTAAAYQVFHRLEPSGIEPERVARFLILNPSHPRSIGYCVREIGEALQMLRGTFRLSRANPCLEAWEVLLEGLQAVARDPNLLVRLHELNDWVQRALMSLTNDIGVAFFRAPEPVRPSPDNPPPAGKPNSQRQHQS